MGMIIPCIRSTKTWVQVTHDKVRYFSPRTINSRGWIGETVGSTLSIWRAVAGGFQDKGPMT